MKRRGLIAGLAALATLALSVGPAAANPKILGPGRAGLEGCGASWTEVGVIHGDGRVVYIIGFTSDFSGCGPSV